jgi:hypothetical protein
LKRAEGLSQTLWPAFALVTIAPPASFVMLLYSPLGMKNTPQDLVGKRFFEKFKPVPI